MTKETSFGPVEINQPASTVVVDYSRLIAPREALDDRPPIDAYYVRTRELVRISGESWCAGQLLGLLTVALVGTVELYVRSVLVGLSTICPAAKQICSRKHVPIAAVTYYSAPELAYAVFDHLPLSDSKAIANAINNLVGFPTNGSSSLEAALTAFDKVCHLRHALTHQTGRLGLNNLFELGLNAREPSTVALNALTFQELIATCHSAVRAINQFLFNRTTERWSTNGTFSSEWSKDETLFLNLCALLVSREDFPDLSAESAYQRLGGILSVARKRAR